MREKLLRPRLRMIVLIYGHVWQPDHENRPLWVCPDQHIFLEVLSLPIVRNFFSSAGISRMTCYPPFSGTFANVLQGIRFRDLDRRTGAATLTLFHNKFATLLFVPTCSCALGESGPLHP